MTKSPDDEYMEQLESENAALKAELKAINAALDDPRTDLTLTAVEVIVALKEQVAQLTSERDAYKEEWNGGLLTLPRSKLETQIAELTRQRDEAVQMLADWCDAVRDNGTGWDDWDEHYKDAAWRQCGIRELIDAARTTEGETE